MALRLGETVVLDASWTAGAWRRAARDTAHQASADLVELRCELPAEVAAERMRRRAATAGDASDATPEIAAAMAAVAAPWPEATTVRTDGSPLDVLTAALQHARHQIPRDP